MEGKGVLRTADGTKFTGAFTDGRMHGPSVEPPPDGSKIECTYKDGERHGKYVEYDRNGNVTKKGEYSNGRVVQ